MDQLLRTIQIIEETHRLKKLLVFTKLELQSWCDSNGMDMLHHAICANNIEAASMLFARGFFKAPHEPTGYPYMHLSSALGHKTILLMLFQERPHDNRPVTYRWNDPRIIPMENICTRFTDGDLKSPLDIAADTNNLRCIHTILDHSEEVQQTTGKSSRANNSSYIYRACLCNSPRALRLLLAKDIGVDFDLRDIREAIGLALKRARPECLDCLLEQTTGRSTSSLFAGSMNLFHVLYSYSLSFSKSWYESLLLVTTVLLKHGQDVMAAVPFRTYPLYSLLSHSSCHDFTNSSSYILACVQLLLNAGADPNFDEMKFEREGENADIATAYGRDSFSSALHCLFHTVCGYFAEVENKSLVSEYLLKTTDVIVSHGGNVNHVAILGDGDQVGNSLHCLFSFCMDMTAEASCSGAVLKLLLRHGADPDLAFDNVYPVNTLIEAILSYPNPTKKQLEAAHNLSKDVYQHMSLKHLTEASRTLQRQILTPRGGDEQDRTVSAAMADLQERISNVWSLKKFCTLNICIYCGRTLSNILKLPLPTPMKNEITTIFYPRK